MRRIILPAVMLLSASLQADAQETASQDEAEAERALAISAEEVQRWQLAMMGAEETELRRTKQPVLRWSNPSAGRVYGDVYLWTQQGRPVAVVSIYKYFSPYRTLTAEFTSLSESALVASRDGAAKWKPEKRGLERRPVPESPRPAASRSGRLLQMRAIAAKFSARLLDRRVDTEGTPQTLRLLSQPVYRYDAEGAIDGGLFAFVVGTDPEIFLLLEAEPGEGGGRWTYGLARMNIDEIRVTHDGSEVWHAPRLTRFTAADQPYCAVELENRD